MSMNSRYRERKYNTSDNDRLLRALSQPVQAWDKKWTQHSNSKTLQTFKWIKSERVIEYEQDEESEEEPEPMETEQSTEVEQVEPKLETEVPVTTVEQVPESIQESENKTVEPVVDAPNSKKSEESIPGGPSSLITNKAISSVQQDDLDDDNSRSQTPKLNDISDEEVDQTTHNNDDDDDDDVDNMNDPSKHPALAPHAEVHMTDDEAMTDSTAATPQTESNTPMPQLEDDHMEEPPQIAHPLSQEILTGIIATEEIASLNNDSPAIQTPEDVVSNHIQRED